MEKDIPLNAQQQIQRVLFKDEVKPLFEYVVVIKLDENYQPILMMQMDWETFFKHKHWHSRVNAYNLIITRALIEDAVVLFDKR